MQAWAPQPNSGQEWRHRDRRRLRSSESPLPYKPGRRADPRVSSNGCPRVGVIPSLTSALTRDVPTLAVGTYHAGGAVQKRLRSGAAPNASADETASALDKGCHHSCALASFEVGEDERPLPAHAAGIALHHLKGCPDVRGEVGLVDDEQIGAGDAGATLARDLLALCHIDYVDG